MRIHRGDCTALTPSFFSPFLSEVPVSHLTLVPSGELHKYLSQRTQRGGLAPITALAPLTSVHWGEGAAPSEDATPPFEHARNDRLAEPSVF